LGDGALEGGGIEVEDELGVVQEFLAVDCRAGKLEFLLQCEAFVSACSFGASIATNGESRKNGSDG
jgi:hypothetical protein